MTTPRPRGRPRTFHRQAALEIATKLFWQYGYEGTSIADLTQAMGVTPPTLYAVFGSKEALYAEVLTYYLALSRENNAWMFDRTISTYELLRSYLYKVADFFTDPTRPPGCMIQTASLNCGVENEGAYRIAAAMRAKAFELLNMKIAEAKEAGELPPEADTQALSRFYNAIIQGLSVQAIDGVSAADLKNLVDIALAAWPGKH
jgi:TetR/AcrR family transcriptional regulator, copper-responsive repressor